MPSAGNISSGNQRILTHRKLNYVNASEEGTHVKWYLAQGLARGVGSVLVGCGAGDDAGSSPGHRPCRRCG